MLPGGNGLESEGFVDPAYPETTPPDPVYPCQTREPLSTPLNGVATPSIASRLVRPMERSLGRLWDGLGLLARNRPERTVALHYGRIALNAHAWERLRANLAGEPPDPALVGPPETGLQQIPELWEAFRVRTRRARVLARLQRAEDIEPCTNSILCSILRFMPLRFVCTAVHTLARRRLPKRINSLAIS